MGRTVSGAWTNEWYTPDEEGRFVRGETRFRDSVTARGAKHLDEMANMVAAGHRAVMVYLVQRADAKRFSLAGDIDPAYVQAFTRATGAGVEVIVCRCAVTSREITIKDMIEIVTHEVVTDRPTVS